jgi:ATP-binding cassette subfamily B (MDR/TAP) protein 6
VRVIPFCHCRQLTGHRILVLKDGHIVEKGSHKELLALDGISASMWADQVSGSEDGLSAKENQPSIHSTKELVDEPEEMDREPSLVESPSLTSGPADFIAFPGGDDTEPIEQMLEKPSSPEAVSFPAGASDVETPESVTQQPESSQPGVTFDESTASGGSPDPTTEPKRKRTASQNFQRLGESGPSLCRDSSFLMT